MKEVITQTALLQAQGLGKTYRHHAVLKSVSLCVEPGTILGLVGRNGAGKSTLLECLSTVLIVLIYMGTMESGYKLTALRRSRSAVLAELCLMPGMPQRAELPAALMRQVLRSKGEQLALMTVALTVILNLQYTPSLAWWIWWVCLIPLLLVVNVASVWLAWHGLHRFKLWEGTCAVGFLIANVLTIQLLSHRNRLEEAWIVFGFLWLALATGVFWWLSRGASKYDQRELYV